MRTKKPLIQVLERAFDILEMLGRTKRAYRSSEIAAELNLSQQTVNNLLRTLYERGYLSQTERREYRLGGQCFYLGACADRWQELRKETGKVLPELRKETGLTVFAGVLEILRFFTEDKFVRNRLVVFCFPAPELLEVAVFHQFSVDGNSVDQNPSAVFRLL